MATCLSRAALLLAAALLAAVVATAADLPEVKVISAGKKTVRGNPPSSGSSGWAVARFVYRADAKRIAEVLQDFASSQGLPAVIADGVDGMVQASFDTSPEEFLNAMTKAYGVLWYHDGTALYFYPAKAIQSRLFRLKGFSRSQVQDMLDSLQLGDRRYPLRYNAAESTLLVYGPPRHVDLVAAALESLDVGATEKNRKVVRVFPLRFASAADRKYGDTLVPGLASTLRSLYTSSPIPQGASPGGLSGATALMPKSAGKMKAMQSQYGGRMVPELNGKAGADAAAASSDGKSSMGSGQRGMRSPVDEDEDSPVFEADEGTNSVIANGRLQRMADYADLIHRLDLKPSLIELEAMIIDVSSDSVDSLGINWSASGAKGSISVSGPGAGPSDSSGVSGMNKGSFSIGTLWANAGRQLLARVDALQARGKARVVAKPKVLGVANRPAVMKENRIAAVRVSGNLEANLFQVEAGTLLQVTPQVTTYDTNARIKLSIYIVDGSFEEGRVDNVPIVKRTEIVTEAHVIEGESLLIGGITIESDATQVNGVPGLSSVPVIGGLFRWKGATSTRSERLFLITPRLLRDIDRLPEAAQSSTPPIVLDAAPAVPAQQPAPTRSEQDPFR